MSLFDDIASVMSYIAYVMSYVFSANRRLQYLEVIRFIDET